MYNRRNFIKSILALGVAHTLDVDKLLWVPGEKKIFIPSPIKPTVYSYDLETTISIDQVILIELERVKPKIQELFNTRDDTFYKIIKDNNK